MSSLESNDNHDAILQYSSMPDGHVTSVGHSTTKLHFDFQETTEARLFDELYTYRPRIFKRLLTLVRNYEIAEELTQETYLKAWRKLNTLTHESNLYGWLFLMATQVFYYYARYGKEKLALFSYDTPDGEEPSSERYNPDRAYADCELMRQALARCNEHDLQTLVSFYIDGNPVEDMNSVYKARRNLNKNYRTLLRKEVAG